MQYYLRNPKIAAEEFDGETILIDIEKGLYFTLGGFAVDLWRLCSDPLMLVELFDSQEFKALNLNSEEIANFLDQLVENNLILKINKSRSEVITPTPLLFTSASTPIFQVYSDLAELIAIDPVHEVDASLGWPARQSNFPEIS